MTDLMIWAPYYEQTSSKVLLTTIQIQWLGFKLCRKENAPPLAEVLDVSVVMTTTRKPEALIQQHRT